MADTLFIVIGIVASVALFLYSVVAFGKEIKSVAGPKVHSLLTSLTSHPLKGVLLGTVSTAILQSSSATSVLIASLADAGFISFYNTLGMIFGVNIGTTITSQLVAYNAMAVAPFIVALGLIVRWWGRGYKKYASSVLYFGLLFLSIYFISLLVSRIDQGLISSYLSMTSNPILAIIIGIVAALVFQSSSVVTGIVLVLAGAGHIGLEQAVGLILGANIGTTSTVIVASLAMGIEAKKVAAAHFLFNVIGVIIAVPFLGYFYELIRWFGGNVMHQVANIHLIFNVACTLVFIIAIKPFSLLINQIFRTRRSARNV